MQGAVQLSRMLAAASFSLTLTEMIITGVVSLRIYDSVSFIIKIVGYFTSRPFYKHMDRTVMHMVRSADILFTLAQWNASSATAEGSTLVSLYDRLVRARRWMSLFQHHDAVAGTARDDVVIDYAKK